MCLCRPPDIKEAHNHTKTHYTKHSIMCWKSTGYRLSLRVVGVLLVECVVWSSELVSVQIAGVRDWESYICHRSWQISVWRVIHITTQPWTDSYCVPLGLGFCLAYVHLSMYWHFWFWTLNIPCKLGHNLGFWYSGSLHRLVNSDHVITHVGWTGPFLNVLDNSYQRQLVSYPKQLRPKQLAPKTNHA